MVGQVRHKQQGHTDCEQRLEEFELCRLIMRAGIIRLCMKDKFEL